MELWSYRKVWEQITYSQCCTELKRILITKILHEINLITLEVQKVFVLNLHIRSHETKHRIWPFFPIFFIPSVQLISLNGHKNFLIIAQIKKYTSNSNFPDKVQVEIIKMITQTGLTEKNCRVQNLMTKIVKESRRVRQKESHQGHLMGICWTSSKRRKVSNRSRSNLLW